MNSQRSSFRFVLPTVAVVILAAAALVLVECGGGSSSMPGSGSGSAQISFSDPAPCSNGKNGPYQHVFVTATAVMAHQSANAGPNDAGWVTLSPAGMTTAPVQVDLLALPQNGNCFLTNLGVVGGIPAGSYQQLRVLLAANNATFTSLSSLSADGANENACTSGSPGGGGPWNCVVTSNGTFALDLPSEVQTGLKIPPGQIVNGPIQVASGQTADIDINFQACAMVVAEGNGGFRLKPALTGQQVTSVVRITGQVVNAVTMLPVANANVWLETQDGNGDDTIVPMQVTTDSGGNFVFCPLMSGETFDLVVDAPGPPSAGGSITVAFNPTVVFNVPAGTAFGQPIPIFAEIPTTTAATISGTVSAGFTTGSSVDIALSTLESATGGSTTRNVFVPLLLGSSPSNGNLALTTMTISGNYSFLLPASSPSAVAFTSGMLSFPTPSTPQNANYVIEGNASEGGVPACSPSRVKSPTSGTLPVTPGSTTSGVNLSFGGC